MSRPWQAPWSIPLSDPYLRLGRAAARHPWWVLGVSPWRSASGAFVGAHRLGQVTLGVKGGVPGGSPSRRAGDER